jgi:hypothetical protein
MNETVTDMLDGTTMQYTYSEMGTVRVSYDNGCVSFQWVAGALQGETGEGFTYRARKVGGGQYFVNWHEPDLHGFVTLYIDFDAGVVHSSVLAAYASDNEQIHFDTASIDRVEKR